MADEAIVCATQVEANAIAAKLNANSRSVATLADRRGGGIHVPLDQVVTERFTAVAQVGATFVVPVPNVAARRSLLSAPERARIAVRVAALKG